jgi:hypothetical protein
MVILIPTTKDKYFRQGLEIIRHIPPLNKLSNRELDVLAYLLYYDYEYRDIQADLREKLVFDYTIRVAIRDSIGVSEAVLNNLLTSIRKKGIIKGKKIIPKIDLNPDTPDIIFKFKIEDVKKD